MKGFIWNIKTEKEFCEVMRKEYYTVTHYNDFTQKYSEEDSFNVTRTYLSDYEKELTDTAIKNKKTVLTPEDVYYYINEYGTRGEWSIKNCKPEYINIAVLGCSFTFGVGISEPKIWPAQIKQNLPSNKHINVINIGYPGSSITKSLKLFKYITDISKIDIAIFLLPTHWREEYPHFVSNTDDTVVYANLIPNFSTVHIEEVWKDYYKYSTEATRLYDTIRHIDHIELIAKNKKVETYYSSWDRELLTSIRPYINKRQELPYFKFLENMLGPDLSNKYARDGSHPGKASHDLFAAEIVDHLVSVSDVEGILTKPKLI